MPPKKKEIPFEDVHVYGLISLIEMGYTQEQMAEYYQVSTRTIRRRLKELDEEK